MHNGYQFYGSKGYLQGYRGAGNLSRLTARDDKVTGEGIRGMPK